MSNCQFITLLLLISFCTWTINCHLSSIDMELFGINKEVSDMEIQIRSLRYWVSEIEKHIDPKGE